MGSTAVHDVGVRAEDANRPAAPHAAEPCQQPQLGRSTYFAERERGRGGERERSGEEEEESQKERVGERQRERDIRGGCRDRGWFGVQGVGITVDDARVAGVVDLDHEDEVVPRVEHARPDDPDEEGHPGVDDGAGRGDRDEARERAVEPHRDVPVPLDRVPEEDRGHGGGRRREGGVHRDLISYIYLVSHLVSTIILLVSSLTLLVSTKTVLVSTTTLFVSTDGGRRDGCVHRDLVRISGQHYNSISQH